MDEELSDWKARGVDIVVSLLDATEEHELMLTNEATGCRAVDIEFISFPIADRGVPESFAATEKMTRRLLSGLQAKKGVVIHCRIGIGRSALVAASVLTLAGVGVDDAFSQISRARGVPVPDTEAQREWVLKFRASV